MGSFLSVVGAPAVRQVAEKTLFGKPYVRLGRLFLVIGFWVYQQGGALGYGLRGHPALLGKLLPRIAPEQAAQSVTSLREVAEARLAEAEGQERNFFHLYVVRELHGLSIDIAAWPPSKELDKKVSPEMASDVMAIAFREGAAVGYHFPELFRDYWDNTYSMRADSEWQEMRARGLELSETQQSRPLEEAVAELAAAAAEWATDEAPGLLSASEFDVLNSLAANTRDAT